MALIAAPAMSWIDDNTTILVGVMGLGLGIWIHFLAGKLWRRPDRINEIAPRDVRAPRFSITMHTLNCFVGSAELEGRTFLALDASVWNLGGAGHIVEWKFRIIPPKAQPEVLTSLKMANDIRLSGANPTVLMKTDSLQEKIDNEVVTQSPIRGILLFSSAHPKEAILEAETRLVLSCVDTHGRVASFEQRIGDWPRL